MFNDEQGLLEQTGGHLAECEACGEPISAQDGYGARCDSCEQDEQGSGEEPGEIER